MESKEKSQQIMNLSPNDLPELQNGFEIYLALPRLFGACSEVWKHFGRFGLQLCFLSIFLYDSWRATFPWQSKNYLSIVVEDLFPSCPVHYLDGIVIDY